MNWSTSRMRDPGAAYFCIDCGAKIFPKNKKKENRKRGIHFSHYSDCPGSLETYLHKLAKLIIDQERRIMLPRLGNVKVKDASIEKQLGNFVPDILLTDETGREIVVEIFVTHITGPDKIDKIKIAGLPAFEIDLSGLSYDAEFELIKFEVIENLVHKRDLNPPERKKEENNYLVAFFIAAITAVTFLIHLIGRKKRRKRY